MIRALILAAALAASTATAAAVPYVYLLSGQRRCFLEELPRDTRVSVAFGLEQLDYNSDRGVVGVRTQVISPEGSVTFEKQSGPIDVVGYNTLSAGEHQFCFATNTSRWLSQIRYKFAIDISTGVSANDYGVIAKQEHLNAVEVSVRRVNDRVTQIRNEQNYQRGREETFRATSESTAHRVIWWAFLQFALLVGLCVWQLMSLKTFFKKKKFGLLVEGWLVKQGRRRWFSNAERDPLLLAYSARPHSPRKGEIDLRGVASFRVTSPGDGDGDARTRFELGTRGGRVYRLAAEGALPGVYWSHALARLVAAAEAASSSSTLPPHGAVAWLGSATRPRTPTEKAPCIAFAHIQQVPLRAYSWERIPAAEEGPVAIVPFPASPRAAPAAAGRTATLSWDAGRPHSLTRGRSLLVLSASRAAGGGTARAAPDRRRLLVLCYAAGDTQAQAPSDPDAHRKARTGPALGGLGGSLL
eukprot:m51a1_g11588 putative transmembrane emp24 domain-containing protein 9-like (470) ;mRNA; f:71096-73491